MSAEITLTLDQQDKIGGKMADLKTLISVFVAASTGRDEFDYEGFAMMLEDKYQELYDTYHEALGDKHRYERFPAR